MTNPLCANCGNSQDYHHVYPLDEHLISTWELSPAEAAIFNEREGLICAHCGANKRAQGLAQAIIESKYGFGATSLADWVKEANTRGLKVCELNSCHELHKVLVGLTNLTYAEYGTPTEQDIENLSYADNSFDMVLHSETLEHVSNPDKAAAECRRVINQDGVVLFTTPVLWNRKSRRRAQIRDGKIDKLLPASYHGYQTDDYLVFQEYGNDIDSKLGVKVCWTDPAHQNYVFTSGKQPEHVSMLRKLQLKHGERKALARFAKPAAG